MQALFEAVRQACSPGDWSRGVELSRGGAVVVDHATKDEVMLRISTRSGMISPTVTLWPEDKDWSCNCSSQTEVCVHVAAAVITLRHAPQAGPEAPSQRPGARCLRYCLTRAPGGLALERAVVQDGKARIFEGTLSALAARRQSGEIVVITQADVAVELALGARRRGWLPREVMPKLFAALSRCADVRLDNVPITTSATPVGLRGCVVDEADGFKLFVEPDASVTEIFANGAVLCGTTLRTVKEPELTAREREVLPTGRYFAASEALELVTDVLPALRKRLPVDIRTRRLPPLVSVPPRIVLEVQREGDALTVLPTLVYGEPPTARVDAGRLVHLGGAIPRRDEVAEHNLIRHLRNTLELVPGHRAQFTAADAVRFAAKLKAWKGEIRGEGHTTFVLTPPLEPRLQLDASTFNLWFETASPGPSGHSPAHRMSAATVLRAWQDGASLVPLTDGGWAPLPLAWLQHFGHRVADLLAARAANGSLPRYAIPELARLCDALEPPPPEFASLQALLEDFHGLPEATLPHGVQAILRPYQRLGVNWLAFLRQAGLGALLADDMGLGKTLQTLCVLQGHTLVVAPTSVLHHWADELRRFRPDLRVSMYHGPQRALTATADVTLTTYAILRLDADKLTQITWDTAVLDEAQAIKNPDSQVARAAYGLRANFRLALTGTPVENRLDELWSQLHFLNRGLLGGRQAFQERYERPMAAGQPGVAAHLREKLKPFVLRRRKREVAPELPPRTDVVLHCVLSDSERVVYDTVRAATLANVVALLNAGGSVLAALEALLRLRQACCHPGLLPGHTASTSTKVALLLERLEEAVADGHKALVFSQWTALLDRIEPHLRTAGMAFTRLDGTTRDRASVVHRFQDEAGPPIMLVSLRAGGTGLNLTAADHIFLLDPWWNPAVEDQAADRAHRIGQTRPVLVYRLVAQDTVEERILALQERKRALAGAALDGADHATAITREELLALLT